MLKFSYLSTCLLGSHRKYSSPNALPVSASLPLCAANQRRPSWCRHSRSSEWNQDHLRMLCLARPSTIVCTFVGRCHPVTSAESRWRRSCLQGVKHDEDNDRRGRWGDTGGWDERHLNNVELVFGVPKRSKACYWSVQSPQHPFLPVNRMLREVEKIPDKNIIYSWLLNSKEEKTRLLRYRET